MRQFNQIRYCMCGCVTSCASTWLPQSIYDITAGILYRSSLIEVNNDNDVHFAKKVSSGMEI